MASSAILKVTFAIFLAAVVCGFSTAVWYGSVFGTLASSEEEQIAPEERPERANDPKDINKKTRQARVNDDLKQLQGAWVLAFLQWSGDDIGLKPQDVTTDAKCILTITGNKAVRARIKPSLKYERFFRIDPTTTPKSIDWSETPDFKEGEADYSIYELDADTLKIMEGGRKPEFRPKEMKVTFRYEKGNDPNLRMIEYWKRVK